jgi:hypothetical protein
VGRRGEAPLDPPYKKVTPEFPMPRLALTFVLLSFAVPAAAAEPLRYPEAKHGKGELKYVHGIPVLILAGAPEEMGEQAAVLGLKPAAGMIAGFKDLLGREGLGRVTPLLRRFAEAMLARYPEAYRREFEAMAKHSGLDRDLLVIGNSFSELRHLAGCSGLMIDPGRSATGGPLMGRSFDLHLPGVHEYQLVIVWRPAGKKPFAVVGFPGAVAACAAASAFKADGLAAGGNMITESADGAPQVDWAKVPSAAIARRVMEECATIEEAVKLVTADRPAERGAVVGCDRTGGAVLEITPKTVAVRCGEGGVCWGTNHCRSKELSMPEAAKCWRADVFAKTKWPAKMTPADVAKAMHAVNQGAATVHTWVFEPKTLNLRLAFGDGKKSATEFPLAEIDLGLFLKPR